MTNCSGIHAVMEQSREKVSEGVAAARQKARDDLAAATLSASVATGGLLLDCLAHASVQSSAEAAIHDTHESEPASLWHIASQLVRFQS